MLLLSADILEGRKCNETVTPDSGIARSFILCEKSVGESVAMLPQVSKIHCLCETVKCEPMCLN